MYSHLSKVLGNVKKKIPLNNQPKPYFFQKLLWSHIWLDFILTNFTPKHSELSIFWLLIYPSVIGLYELLDSTRGTTRNAQRQEKYTYFKMMNIFNTNTRSQFFYKLGFSIIIINLVLLSSNGLIIYICMKLLSEVMNGL